MPLYGHELNESINPLEAGLGFAVSWQDGQGNDRDFIGRDALADLQSAGLQRRRVGLQLEGRRAAREGYSVLRAGQPIGTVTSGTYSPTLERPISMAYVDLQYAEVDTEVEVDIRGKSVSATVCCLPFYKRTG